MRTSRDERGQSEVLGVVLLLGLTVISVGAVIAAGAVAVDDTRTTVQTTAVENAMYRYDAAATEVAYGTADRRRVSLGETGEGRYEVRPDVGTVRITHRNHSGTDEVILEQSLGAFVYERGDTEIAYQGGGIFRKDGEGSVVLSAPPLAYRYPTFTAPVVRVRGDGSVGGAPTVALDGGGTDVFYPNPSESYQNPVSGGAIVVSVESEYAHAWESYFERISTDVNVTRSGDEVTMELPTEPPNTDFSLAGSYTLRGVGESEHLIQKMTLSMDRQSKGKGSFNDMGATIKGERAAYEITFENNEQFAPCSGKDDDNDPTIEARVEYIHHETTHTWTKNDAVNDSTGAFTYDCDDGFVLNVDLTGSTKLNYTGSAGVTFDEHPEDANLSDRPYLNDATFTSGEKASIDLLTNHYLGLIGGSADIYLSKNSGPGSDSSQSSGYIEYDRGKSSIVTYLRVTNSEVESTVS